MITREQIVSILESYSDYFGDEQNGDPINAIGDEAFDDIANEIMEEIENDDCENNALSPFDPDLDDPEQPYRDLDNLKFSDVDTVKVLRPEFDGHSAPNKPRTMPSGRRFVYRKR
jgi:hypothetical protein